MGFLDELVSTTKNVAATAGKKTDEAVKLSKLKMKKAQTNSDIKGKYEKLGELVYEMAKAGEKDNDNFDAVVAEIDALTETLEDIERQIDEVNGTLTCVNCGAKTKNDNSYCPKCGTKLPVIETVKEEAAVAEEAAPAEEKAEDVKTEE